MKKSTALNHQNRLLGHIKEAFHFTEVCRYNHTKHVERIKEKVWNDPAYKKLPGHVKSFLSGYERCLWENFTIKKIVWVLPFENVNYLCPCFVVFQNIGQTARALKF